MMHITFISEYATFAICELVLYVFLNDCVFVLKLFFINSLPPPPPPPPSLVIIPFCNTITEQLCNKVRLTYCPITNLLNNRTFLSNAPE